MKLHLPKQLFTALLAAITLAAPAAWGLVITGTGDLEVITLKASQSYDGVNFDYTVTDGIGVTTSLTQKENGATDDDVEITFTLNNNAFKNVTFDNDKDSAKIVWVKNTASAARIWGFAAYNANTDDDACEVTGMWQGDEWKPENTSWITGNATATSNTYIDISDSATTTTYTATIGESGTTLKDAASTTVVYNQGNLKSSGTDVRLQSVYINSAFVSTFQAKEYSTLTFSNGNGWSKSYTRTELNNAVSSVMEVGLAGVANAYDIVAGGSGGLVITAAADEQVAVSNTLYLASAATNGDAVVSITNNGAVNLNGLVYLVEDSKISTTSGAGTVTFGGKVTDKGVPTGSENATVDGAYTLSLSGTGYNFAGGLDVTGLSLESGASVSISSAADIGTLSAASGTVSLAENATLTLGNDTNASTHSIGTVVASSAGNTIRLNDKATLNRLSSVTGTVILTGSGTYHYGSYTSTDSFALEFTLDEDYWTGTVALTGGDRFLSLNNLSGASTSNSKLKLTGFKGYLSGTATTMTNNLVLENGNIREDAGYGYGILLDNGTTSENPNVTFSGSVEGDGHIIYGWENTNKESEKSYTATHIFSGDTSKWNGMFIRDLRFTEATGNTYGKNVIVKFTAGGDVFKENGNGGVMDGEKSGQLGVVIDAAESDGVKPNTNFHGAITDVNSVTVNSNTDFKKAVTTASLTVAASTNTSFDSTLDADTVTLNDSSTLALGGGTVEPPVTHSIGTLSAASGTVTLAGNTTLNLGGGTAEAPITHSIGTLTGGAGSTLNLAQHSVLNTITTASGVTLTGSGTYVLASGTMTMTSGVTLGADWTGAVRLSGNIDTLDLAGSLYNKASWVEFAGITGYLKQGPSTYGANIRLTDIGENAAITLNNGWTGDTHTFSGKIEGEGTWKRTASNGTVQNYVFAGDVAEWTGALVNAIPATHGTAATATNLTFQGASAINVDISNPGADAGNVGALNVTINDAAQGENKSAVAVNGSIQATKLTVDTAVSADFSNTVDVDTLEVNSGKTATFNNTATAGAVTNSGKIKLGEAATVTGGSMSKVQMSSTGITGTAQDGSSSISDADIEIAQLAEDASFTIQDMTLTNTTITAATPTTQVNLQNVAATNLALAQGKFTMNAAPTVGTGGTTANFGTNTDSSFMISKLTAGSASLTLNLDVMGAYESTGAVDNVTLTITLAGITGDVSSYGVDAWKALVGFEESSWLGQALVIQKAEYTVVTEQTPATPGEGGVPTVNYGYASTGSNVGTLTITISGLNVPEPASATLGLAALMMLCARRRRKA